MEKYNYIQILLHDIILGNRFIKKSLYEFEKLLYLNKDIKFHEQKHVFISGLPRSGTTAILNFFYSTNEYLSLTYKKMPFVLTPNISSLLEKKKNIKKTIRMHQDGILFDLESPEALDEVFFSTYEDELKNELINYLSLLFLHSKKKRYLSKNNMNYNRINLINEILPNSIFLIPYREPLQHANSLLSQHLNFSKIQAENDFVRRYMNYLGHNEFGINHKSWSLPVKFNNFDNINYWLEQWSMFYSKIFNLYKNKNNCFFIKYESLNEVSSSEKLLSITSTTKTPNYNFKTNRKAIDINYDFKLYDEATDIYNTLNKSFVI